LHSRCSRWFNLVSEGGETLTEGHDIEGLREAPVNGVQERDGAVVVELAGELDLYNAHTVRDALLGQAEKKPERLVVDLSRVTFIDSTGLGVLIEARTRLPNRRAFMLASPGLETRRALEISGLDRHFAVHDSLDAALAAPI
jgi:anti-sigma B factor antagonist